ncbi:MAG: prolyl oligopeptidase family serine peptidase [Chloroflexi bacterium]|nr:prolyl oligopeptidase family serine peptidase [Chloroflexota bacterium]
MMKRIRWIRVLLMVVLAFVVSAYAYFVWDFSDIILSTPQTSLLEATMSQAGQGRPSDPLDVGLPEPEEIRLVLAGAELHGWYFENPADAQCGVMLLHGRFQTRLEMLSYAPLYWERGCDIIMYDARSHGDSLGQYVTWGYHERQDALAVLDWFMQRSGLRVEQIGMMGASFGAATSLLTVALEPELAFVAADSPFASLSQLLNEQASNLYGEFVRASFTGPSLWLAGVRGDFQPDEVAPATTIQEIAPPVFLLHARKDSVIPVHHAEIIFSNADPNKTVLHITDWGAGHVASIRVDFAAYQALMDDFLATHVPDFGE